MPRAKELKVISKIRIDGELKELKDLPEEQRKEISQKLYEQAMAALGYKKVS